MVKEDITQNGFYVSVLGTDYLVKSWTREDHPKYFEDKCGECDAPQRRIIVENLDGEKRAEKNDDTANPQEFMNQTLRHELVHAFFFENGFGSSSQWANSEVLVDWIALQAPKLMRLFMQAKAFSDEDVESFIKAYQTPNRKLVKKGDLL